MAVAFEGFSIREYAESMRSVDLDKCWPFDGGGGGRRSLPQISVRKFRFWSDEVKIVGEERAEEIPAFRTTPSKGKLRTPKKRSIVELFAVAPPIEAAVGASIDANIEVKEMESSKKVKKTTKKLMKWGMIKRRKKKVKVEICTAKKEKIDKPASSTHIFRKLQGSKHKLSSEKKSKNPVDSGRKLAQKKNPKSHKLKLIQSSKKISKKQNGPGKVRMRKSRARGSAKKAGANTNTQRGNFESENRLPVFGEDGLVGHTKSCSPIDIPQLRSLCKMFSDVLAASSALDNTCEGDNLPAAADMAPAENGSDITNAVRNIVEQAEGTSSEKEQLSEPRSDLMHPSNKSYSDTERSAVSILADKHHSMQTNDVHCFIPGTSTLLASGKHLEEPRMIEPIHCGELTCSSDTQLKETSHEISGSQSLTPPEGPASGSDVRGSLSFIGNPTPVPSVMCSTITMEENRQQLQPPVSSLIDSSWHITELHPIHHLPSKDLMESMLTSVGSRLVPHPAPASKDKCIAEGFVGLPLNSQGELINLQSGRKFGFSEISKRQNVIQSSAHSSFVPCHVKPRTSANHVKLMKGKFPGEALNPKTTLNQNDRSSGWPQEQYFHFCKPAISGNGFTNLQSFERFGVRRNETSSGKDHFFLHDPERREVSFQGCREEDRTQNYIDRVNSQAEGIKNRVSQPNIQQTMRLMGTNVTVGGNNKQSHSHVDGKIWTDKEVVTDKYPSVSVSDRSLPQKWLQQQQQQQQQWVMHQPSGMPNDDLFHPMDASSNLYHMPATAQRLGLTHFDYRPQWVSRNGTSSAAGNHHLKVDILNHPVNHSSLLNESSTSVVTSIPGITSVPMGHQVPFVALKPQAYQHMLLNSTHCKHSQGNAYSTTSTFCPPFLYHETGSSIQQSALQSSANLPQWLLNAKQQKKSQEVSCTCFVDPISSYGHTSMAHTEGYPFPSPHLTSTIFSACSTSQRGGLSTASGAQNPFNPSCTISKMRTATGNSSRRKNMLRDGTNFNSTYLKCSDAASKSRKRSAAKDDRFMKPAKKPFLRLHEDTSASAGLGQGEQMDRNTPHAETTTIFPNNSEIVTENEGLRSLSLCSSLKFDSGSKSGPIKLSAGAKHILKPSQGTDQDNSMCTHSTIAFSIENISSKVLDPQVKAAEIYRF